MNGQFLWLVYSFWLCTQVPPHLLLSSSYSFPRNDNECWELLKSIRLSLYYFSLSMQSAAPTLSHHLPPPPHNPIHIECKNTRTREQTQNISNSAKSFDLLCARVFSFLKSQAFFCQRSINPLFLMCRTFGALGSFNLPHSWWISLPANERKKGNR